MTKMLFLILVSSIEPRLKLLRMCPIFSGCKVQAVSNIKIIVTLDMRKIFISKDKEEVMLLVSEAA